MFSKRVKPNFWLSLPNLTEAERMWVAAIIDCEGTLTIHTPWNIQRNNRNIQIFGRVEMVGLALVKKLKELCGGSLRDSVRQRGNRKIHSMWNISSNGLRWLLPQILPFLLIKKRHAEILIEVLTFNHRGERPTQMKYQRLAELINELRPLNARGMKPDLAKIRPTKNQGKDILCFEK